MRGEFIGVWSEMWPEVWAPLINQEEVPDDVFCQLYGEIASALREPSAEVALALALNDAVQLREALDRALVIANIDVDLARREEVFNGSGCASLDGAEVRRGALGTALGALIDNPVQSADALSQALSELVGSQEKRAEALGRALESIVNDPCRSREAFQQVRACDLKGERAVVDFLESANGVLEDLGGDRLANLYFNLLEAFVAKFSLRYDVRRPCILCPTLPGLFASLLGELRALGSQDSEVGELLKDFEEAVRDLRFGSSSGRIKTCITKEVMLLEALASMTPAVTKGTLGAMCEEIGSWPHPAVRESLKNLYGFASDRSGIRHGKSQVSAGRAERAMEMRDMVAMSILLAGFTPYLIDQLDADVVFRGG
jgi:hypothetical protein